MQVGGVRLANRGAFQVWETSPGSATVAASAAALTRQHAAAEGRAPAWGMGLVAQHTCREQVERVPVWHKARPFHQLKCDCMRWCTLMLPNLKGCTPAWGNAIATHAAHLPRPD